MKLILLITGVILFINGSFLCVLSNLNLGVILTILLGIFFVLWGIFYDSLRLITKKGIMKYIKRFIILIICTEMLFAAFIGVYGQSDNADFDEDALIVLGAGVRGDEVTLPLKMRLDKAVEYHKVNPNALIVVTGGKGFQETVTEAYAMGKYLIANGVKQEKIIKEEEATSTNENMRFSKKILDADFNHEYKTAVITNNFHIFRSVSIAKAEGLKNVTHMHAGLQWYNIVPCYLRESLAILKMWILG